MTLQKHLAILSHYYHYKQVEKQTEGVAQSQSSLLATEAITETLTSEAVCSDSISWRDRLTTEAVPVPL